MGKVFFGRMLLLLLGLWSLPRTLEAQAPSYPPVNEHLLLDTRWRYTYMSQWPSNRVLHKADSADVHYLYLRYDYAFERYLNGQMSVGTWGLNRERNVLFCPFRKIEQWRIARFDREVLILEYDLYEGQQTYRYHFVRVKPEESPFEAAGFDFPLVEIYAEALPRTERYRHLKAEKGKRGRQKRRSKRPIEPVEAPPFIQIEMVGGGFFGGPDPVYRNNLVIHSDGRVLHEIKSELQGLRVSSKQIPRESLEELANFIEAKRFFEFQQVYGCETRACQERLQQSPRPVAFRLVVTYKHRRKVVALPIWEGPGRSNGLIDYPAELDAIVRAIERLALH